MVRGFPHEGGPTYQFCRMVWADLGMVKAKEVKELQTLHPAATGFDYRVRHSPGCPIHSSIRRALSNRLELAVSLST